MKKVSQRITHDWGARVMRRKILVVDDSEVALEVIKDDLEDGGFEVLTAESGVEALKLLGEGDIPDAIIVDLEMPEMSGADFCKTIRAQENTQHIPLYLITIKKETEVADIIKESGATGYLWKARVSSMALSRLLADLK